MNPKIIVNSAAYVALLRCPGFVNADVGATNTDYPLGTVGYVMVDQMNHPGPVKIPVVFGGDNV